MDFGDKVRFGMQVPDDPDPIATIEQLGAEYVPMHEGERVVGTFNTLSEAIEAAEEAGFAVALSADQIRQHYGEPEPDDWPPLPDDLPF
jgi:hypothetical protein